MLLKRTNRYSALRIPLDLNYIISMEKRNRTISKYKNIGKCIRPYKSIYSRAPVSIEVHNGKLMYFCCNCGKNMKISNERICSTRFIRCDCDCLNDMKSKNAMRYYLIYETDLYNQIISKRKSDRLASNNRKLAKRKANEEKALRTKEPLIVAIDRKEIFPSNKAIVPAIWKEIMLDDTLTQKEKEILCEMQLPVSKYKLLKVLGVTFDDNSKQLTDDEIREIKKATIIDVDKSESIKHYY